MFDAFVIRGSVLVVVAIFEVTQPTTSGTNKSLWHLHALPLEQVLHCASNFTQLMHFVGLQVDDGDDSLVSVEVRQLLAAERHPALSDNQKKDVEARATPLVKGLVAHRKHELTVKAQRHARASAKPENEDLRALTENYAIGAHRGHQTHAQLAKPTQQTLYNEFAPPPMFSPQQVGMTFPSAGSGTWVYLPPPPAGYMFAQPPLAQSPMFCPSSVVFLPPTTTAPRRSDPADSGSEEEEA